MKATTTNFASAARTLGSAARQRGLVVPGFRCPPRIIGADRTIRRLVDSAMVAVRVKDRAWVAVLADMIEGVVVANRLVAPRSDRLRRELWDALGFTDASLPSAQSPKVA